MPPLSCWESGWRVFSIGFGKRLIGFRKGETDYRIMRIPLGGYVKMSGENPMDSAPAILASSCPSPLATFPDCYCRSRDEHHAGRLGC